MAFECGICTSNYNSAARAPLILPCGHTFCRECVQGRLGGGGGGAARACAFCRTPVRVRLDELPRNYALEGAMQAANLPVAETLERWGLLAGAERWLLRADALELAAPLPHPSNGVRSEVWRGSLRGAPAAVKLLRLEDAAAHRAARREAAALLRLAGDAPRHVCAYKGVAVKGPYFCIVTKLYARSLAQELAAAPAGRLPAAVAVRRAADVARGLAELHAAGVAHGALRPAKVLVERAEVGGAAVVAGLGSSRAFAGAAAAAAVAASDDAADSGSSSNGGGAIIAYMAPEQFDPRWASDGAAMCKADVWSFGCTLLHMLSGRAPWGGYADRDVRAAVAGRRAAPPLPAAGLPRELEAILSACFAPEPARRPAAAQLARALAALAPRVEPAAAGLRAVAARRERMLGTARAVLAGLKDDVARLAAEMEGGAPLGSSSGGAGGDGDGSGGEDAEDSFEHYLRQLGVADEAADEATGSGAAAVAVGPAESAFAALSARYAAASQDDGGVEPSAPPLGCLEAQLAAEGALSPDFAAAASPVAAVAAMLPPGWADAPVARNPPPGWGNGGEQAVPGRHARSMSEQVWGSAAGAAPADALPLHLQQQQQHYHPSWQQAIAEEQQQQQHHRRCQSEAVARADGGANAAAGPLGAARPQRKQWQRDSSVSLGLAAALGSSSAMGAAAAPASALLPCAGGAVADDSAFFGATGAGGGSAASEGAELPSAPAGLPAAPRKAPLPLAEPDGAALLAMLRGGAAAAAAGSSGGSGSSGGGVAAAAAQRPPGFWGAAIRGMSPDRRAARSTGAGADAAAARASTAGSSGKSPQRWRQLFGAPPAVGAAGLEQQQQDAEAATAAAEGDRSGSRSGSPCRGGAAAAGSRGSSPSPRRLGAADGGGDGVADGAASPLRAHKRHLSLHARAALAPAADNAGAESAARASPCTTPRKRWQQPDVGDAAADAAADADAAPGADGWNGRDSPRLRMKQQEPAAGTKTLDSSAACDGGAAADAEAAAAAACFEDDGVSGGGAAALAAAVAAAADEGSSAPPSAGETRSYSQQVLEAARLEAASRAHAAAGRAAEAESAARAALALLRAAAGPKHPNAVACAARLAGLLARRGAHAEAEPLFREVLAHREALLGRSHPQVATALSNVAACQTARGDLAGAAQSYRAALAARAASLGDAHLDTAAARVNLGLCLSRLGRHAEAEPLHRAALDTRSAALPHDHPDTAAAAHHLGTCLAALGRDAEALAAHKRALEAREAHAAATAAAAAAAGAGASNAASLAAAARSAADAALASHRAIAGCLRRLGADADAGPHLDAILAAARRDVAVAASGGGNLGGGGKAPALSLRDARIALADAAAERARAAALSGAHDAAEAALWEAFDARREALGARHPSVIELEDQLRSVLEALSV